MTYHDDESSEFPSAEFDSGVRQPPAVSPAAADWSSDALEDEGPGAAPELPTDAQSRLDAADLRFVHVLLEQCFTPSIAEGVTVFDPREARIERVMAAIQAESAPLPAAHVAAIEATPLRPAQGARRRSSLLGRFAAMLATAAAIGGIALVFSWTASGRQTVQAAVDAMYRAAAQPKDRHYLVKARFQDLLKGTESHVVTDLYVRGGDKFVLRHPTLLGDLWIGSNGRQGWMVNPFNMVLGRKDPKLTLAWARDEGITMPELQLTALLDEARQYFELELLPAEAIDPRESSASFASSPTLSDPYVAWQRIRCRPKSLQPHQPYLMELWAHPDTGVLRRIVFHWRPFSKFCGLTEMTVDLTAEQPRSDAWYEPAAHLNPQPAPATKSHQQPAA